MIRLPYLIQNCKTLERKYQQGVPTKVFLERCLSPVSNMQADTPKSANLTAPLESIKMFPACHQNNERKSEMQFHPQNGEGKMRTDTETK